MVEEKVKLGDIEDRGLIRLGRGKVISKEDMLKEPGDYPVYSSSASGTGEFGRYGQYMFDDIRISWSVDGGGKFFYRDDDRYSITNVCGWIQNLAPDKIDLKYLYYALFAEWTGKSYDYSHKAHPSVIRNEYMLFLPPLPEQRRIAAVLSDLDDYIEKQERLIEKNKKFRDGVISSLVPNLSVLGDDERALPDGWEIKPLHKLAVIVMGHSPKSQFYNQRQEGLPLVQGNADIVERVTVPRQYTTFTTNTADIGDIIMTVRAPVGSVAKADQHCCIGRGVCALKDASEYLYHYLIYMEDKWVGNEGSIFDSITSEKLYDTLVPVPSIEEQQRIASIMSNLDDNIAKQQEKLDKARKLKDALLNELISGKIRLTDDSDSRTSR